MIMMNLQFNPNNIPYSNYTISPHNPKSEIMPVQLIPHRSTQDILTRPLAPCHVRSSWTCLGWTLPIGPSGSMNDDKIHWELNKKLRTRSNIKLISTYLEAFRGSKTTLKRCYLALLGSLKKSFGPGALPSLASRPVPRWKHVEAMFVDVSLMPKLEEWIEIGNYIDSLVVSWCFMYLVARNDLWDHQREIIFRSTAGRFYGCWIIVLDNES